MSFTNGSHRINKLLLNIKEFLYLFWRIKRQNPTTFLALQTEMRCTTHTLLSFIFKHEGWGFATFFANYSLKNFTENFCINETIACCIWQFFSGIRPFYNVDSSRWSWNTCTASWLSIGVITVNTILVGLIYTRFLCIFNKSISNKSPGFLPLNSLSPYYQWNNFRLFGNKPTFGVINHEERERKSLAVTFLWMIKSSGKGA
jgi:hypothetical protein